MKLLQTCIYRIFISIEALYYIEDAPARPRIWLIRHHIFARGCLIEITVGVDGPRQGRTLKLHTPAIRCASATFSLDSSVSPIHMSSRTNGNHGHASRRDNPSISSTHSSSSGRTERTTRQPTHVSSCLLYSILTPISFSAEACGGIGSNSSLGVD